MVSVRPGRAHDEDVDRIVCFRHASVALVESTGRTLAVRPEVCSSHCPPPEGRTLTRPARGPGSAIAPMAAAAGPAPVEDDALLITDNPSIFIVYKAFGVLPYARNGVRPASCRVAPGRE